ncbi:titin homolog [Rhincodon typus]|uniref:titin homolog n=1 Tax=Rhincodon typus TaxID=259920 RepID=UPI00202E130C|nr:titin homolog [Rhincodon typus]
MSKIKNGDKTRVKLQENTEGDRTRKLLINAEVMCLADVLTDPRQLLHRASHKKPGRAETYNLTSLNTGRLSRAISIDHSEDFQCGMNENFEENENTLSQNPPCPAKVHIVKKEKKNITNKSKTAQGNVKIFEKPRIIITVMKPFGLRVLRSNPVPNVNVSIRHIQKWKKKIRTQTKQQSEDIQKKKIMIPVDNHLENSNDYIVKKWIQQKNMLLRKERERKKKQRRLEKANNKRQEIDRQKRQKESEEKVKMWMKNRIKNSSKKNININESVISLSTDKSAQNAKVSPPVVNAVKKSISQNPIKTLKTEKQITEEKLELKKKRVLIPGTRKSTTETVSSKPYFVSLENQLMNLCKVDSTMVPNSKQDNQEFQKSNSKKAQKVKLLHQPMEVKSFSKPTSFKVTKRDSPCFSNKPQTKELNNGNSKSRKHLIHNLPFNELLSRKSKKPKELQAKVKEKEPELDKNLQTVVSKVANKQMQNKIDSKKSVFGKKEFGKLANISLASEFTAVTPKPKWLQEAKVTPAVKNWFVHRLEENLNGENSDSSPQDGQKVQLKTSYSLCGKTYEAAK